MLKPERSSPAFISRPEPRLSLHCPVWRSCRRAVRPPGQERSCIPAKTSTTTTARATTIGSWRPLISMAMFSPSLLMVCWEAATDGVGLKPARTTISLPSLIPPKIPPAWLVSLTMEPSAFTWKASLLVSPVAVQTEKPSPISTPFTAPMETSAFARLASSFSNTGSPTPAGIW